MRRSISIMSVGLALIVAWSAMGRPLGAQTSGRERALYVSVVDRRGEPVTDIAPTDFIVREDGVQREVLRVSRATEPIDIALLIDNSAASDDHIVSLRVGLTRFVEAMHRENNIALIGLADRPTILTDYTRDVTRLKAGIGKVFASPLSGMTLLDALVETSKGMEKRDAPRAALVAVITDGPELGHFDDRSVIKAVQAAGAAFHAVTIGTFADMAPDPLLYRNILLADGTTRSGGGRQDLFVATGVPPALEKLARELSSQQKIIYARPASLIQPESIEVRVARPGITVRGTPARRPGGLP